MVQIQERIQRLFGRGFPSVAGNTVAEQRAIYYPSRRKRSTPFLMHINMKNAGAAAAIRISRIFPGTSQTPSSFREIYIWRISCFSMRAISTDTPLSSSPSICLSSSLRYFNPSFMRNFMEVTSRRVKLELVKFSKCYESRFRLGNLRT